MKLKKKSGAPCMSYFGTVSDCLMTPYFLKWSFGPKIESVDGICHQTDSMNRFYLDVKTGPYYRTVNSSRQLK